MAAPIHTTATARAAEVLDLEQARKHRAHANPGPTPDEVRAEYDRATRGAMWKFDRDFGPAVYRTLLADLAIWPAAFQRRVGEPLRDARDGTGSRFGRWHSRPDWIWERFQEGRRVGAWEDAPDQAGCGCGCRGFNSDYVRHLRLLRDASREAREARAKAVHAVRAKAVLQRRRERIAEYKRELLELLWLRGDRRIDRARLRQHAAEHTRAELADVRRWLTEAPAKLRECRERLRENRTYNRRGPTDRPLSAPRRLEFEREIEETKRRVPEWRTRAAHLEALLADEHALARQWTGCARHTAEAR